MKTAVVLVSQPDNSFTIERISGSDSSLLDALQKAVGGYIEAVTGDTWHLYCNEEGKLNGLPVNATSTVLLNQLVPGFATRDVLVGSIVWLGNGEDGAESSVPMGVIREHLKVALSRVGPSNSITVIRYKKDVWVYDVPDNGPVLMLQALVRQLRAHVRVERPEEPSPIEVYTGVTPARWVEVRAEIMDDGTVTLHDERDDRSYE